MTTLSVSGRRALAPSLLIALPVLFLLVFFVLPTMLLLSVGFFESDGMGPVGGWTLENFHTLLTRPLYYRAILRSFLVGTAVGALVIVLSYPLAYFLVRTTSRWRNLLIAVSLAPLLASVIVRTYGWWVVLNREGAVNTFLKSVGLINEPLVLIPSTPAIIIGLAHALLPYGVLTIIASLNGLNPNLERAAMSLGANRFRTFLSVTLPLTLPGIIGGFLLAFAIAISAYATPAILGGPATEVMATMIRTFMAVTLDWALGSAMGAILLVSAIGLLILTSVLAGRQNTAS
jgi:putative spermidine/putrescine transport system permease protein